MNVWRWFVRWLRLDLVTPTLRRFEDRTQTARDELQRQRNGVQREAQVRRAIIATTRDVLRKRPEGQ